MLVGKPPVIVAKLRQGNYFGEALIISKPRAATIQANTFCDLFTLTRAALVEVLEYYPETSKQMHALVAKRLEEDRAKERQAELVNKYGKRFLELLETRKQVKRLTRLRSFRSPSRLSRANSSRRRQTWSAGASPSAESAAAARAPAPALARRRDATITEVGRRCCA